MTAQVKPKRAYDASRRREQARESRRAMLDAARRLFLAHGYADTTMPMIAEEAGVSVQTLYKAFENKPGLVKALVDVALVGDDEPAPMMEREFVQRNMAEPDARKKLLDYGAHLAEIAPRAQPILLVVRDAAAVDGGAAEVWQRLQAERLTGMTHFAQHLKSERFLRRGVSVAEARDVLWAHNSVELWDLLVRQRGWTPARYGRWIANQLVAALL
ncbi:MAG: TetR family transcriptional regulator [Actinomycetia bacterium]|nr:TetR family transcriptional regulator [Actinomycetes bacterium]